MMEENEASRPTPTPPKKHPHPQVVVVRDWKEYLGESALIIFSVLLALILTEWVNKIRENQETVVLIEDVRNELISNKKFVEEQYRYHQQVIRTIDSALVNQELLARIVQNNEFNLKLIAPAGIQYRFLSDAAWDRAKQHNIAGKIGLNELAILSHIYQDQVRIMKTEEEVANVFLDWRSRDPANTRVALILMRDKFHGWAVDRVPGLLIQYQLAIDQLK
jgi:hypothetical protein